MTIGNIILAHQHSAQLVRLIDRLPAPSVSFFVHIDRRADDATHRAVVDALSGRHNGYFLPRHPSVWASWGIVDPCWKTRNKWSARPSSPTTSFS
jgi:hypothetical protein